MAVSIVANALSFRLDILDLVERICVKKPRFFRFGCWSVSSSWTPINDGRPNATRNLIDGIVIVLGAIALGLVVGAGLAQIEVWR